MKCAFCSTEVKFEIEKDGRYCPECGVKQPAEEKTDETEVGSSRPAEPLHRGVGVLLYVVWTIVSVFIFGIAALIREGVRRPIGQFFFSFLDAATASIATGIVVIVILGGAVVLIVLGYRWIRRHSKAQKQW